MRYHDPVDGFRRSRYRWKALDELSLESQKSPEESEKINFESDACSEIDLARPSSMAASQPHGRR